MIIFYIIHIVKCQVNKDNFNGMVSQVRHPFPATRDRSEDHLYITKDILKLMTLTMWLGTVQRNHVMEIDLCFLIIINTWKLSSVKIKIHTHLPKVG